MIPANPQTIPISVPTSTCARLCCSSTIRLVITQPDSNTAPQSHHTGLKPKIAEYATNPPITAPEPAECILTFQNKFTMMQHV